MKRIKTRNVLPGDILLTARPRLKSAAIRRATHGIVSHAMICVQRGSVVDSTADGVQARNLQRELFDEDETVFQFRLREDVSSDVLSAVIDYARAEVGARYSVAEAMRSAGSLRKPRTKRQFCSRLVARAYKQAGIDLVPDADYCSPEDLRRSTFLTEIPIETETITDDEVAWWSKSDNPIQRMIQAQNTILDVARSIDPGIESFDDLFGLLVAQPTSDKKISTAFRDSGYLDLWRTERDAHPWRYDHDLINKITSPDSMADLREYCIHTVAEAYSGGLRFSSNLIQLRALNDRHPRDSFRLEIELYETLVKLDQMRREVAYGWLLNHYFEDLKRHMEQIEPHSAYWHSIVERVEPKLAMLSRMAVDSGESLEVCSSCGDEPATAYRLVNGADTMPGVPSLRLCEDCIDVRRAMGNELLEFLPRPT